MTGDLRIAHYDYGGGREAMLRFGPETGPSVLAALPLFEEANRMRAFVVAILRGLARRGIGGALPDLPGQGESPIATEAATLAGWRAAFAAAATALPEPLFALGFRGGAMLDGTADVKRRWHFAPTDGAAPVADLRRAAVMAAAARGDRFTLGEIDRNGPPLRLAGNLVSPGLLSELATAAPAAARVVRLDSDPAPADRKLPGAPLWRRIEPGNDSTLAAALAEDIAQWIAVCDA